MEAVAPHLVVTQGIQRGVRPGSGPQAAQGLPLEAAWKLKSTQGDKRW